MIDGIDDMMVRVRADTSGFARDVATMRASLEGPFAAGADRAGRVLETTLLRAVRTGQAGFEDLGRVALRVMDGIASQALRGGLDALLGGGGGGGRGVGLAGFLSAMISGAPGRATGGPVSPDRPYWVGERGPELFVPTASGRVEATAASPRDVRISIAINAPPNAAPEMLARSSRQVARAVRDALVRLD